jgi:subtilase family serine protease
LHFKNLVLESKYVNNNIRKLKESNCHEFLGKEVVIDYFKTTDSKKEEFRKYLEKSGVIDQLTRVLVGLYEEPDKPGNAIE